MLSLPMRALAIYPPGPASPLFTMGIATSLLIGVKLNHIISFSHNIRAAVIHVTSEQESHAMRGDFTFSLNPGIESTCTHTRAHTHTHTHTHSHRAHIYQNHRWPNLRLSNIMIKYVFLCFAIHFIETTYFDFVCSTVLCGKIILGHILWKRLLLPLQFLQ
jgi:hypothetical protein